MRAIVAGREGEGWQPLEPARAFGTRELAAAAGIDPANASRWLRRWSEASAKSWTVPWCR
jgi:hypothetical protein